MTAVRFYSAITATAAAVFGAAVYVTRLKRKSPEDHERERRLWLSERGRIVDGTVTDAVEMPAPEPARRRRNGAAAARGPVQLIIYRYDIAGVEYEASQDVTYLRQFIDLHSCRLGLPASIKYDPRNPSNSIVIAESWSGLRRGSYRVQAPAPSPREQVTAESQQPQ
jgi:hypothetical protein